VRDLPCERLKDVILRAVSGPAVSSSDAEATWLRGMTSYKENPWFTEGFDTADLKDTQALLDELGN
jgi:hypothetical protein